MRNLDSSDIDFSLSQNEISLFNAQGFLGPFSLYTPDEIKEKWARAKIDLALSKSKPHDSKVINYDRHLDVQFLSDHICRPEIVHRLASLMGQDVLCWRSEMFPKYPGEDGTGWHQVETFKVGEARQGALTITERHPSYLSELTVWTAFTPANKEKGCLTFIPGSHKKWYYDETKIIHHSPQDKKHNFFGYDYAELKVDEKWDPDNENHISMEMEAGQFVIFTAKCVHGSLPNISSSMRMGYASRYVRPSVKVYEGMDSLTEFGGSLSLDYFGCVLVSGKDNSGLNKLHEKNFLNVPFKKSIIL